MSAHIPPFWAMVRAAELKMAEPSFSARAARVAGDTRQTYAFARYIADHEAPPIDPLLIEAREIAAATMDKEEPQFPALGRAFRDGEHDASLAIDALLAALKRGMELAEKAITEDVRT